MNATSTALAALLLAIPLSSSAQEPVRFTPLPAATMEELARYPTLERTPRAIRQKTFAFPAMLGRIAATADPAPVAPTITAPPMKALFNSDTTDLLSPADASGAVGPHHVVGVYNSGVLIHDRSGAILSEVRLEQFWGEPSRRAAFYDPRVVYDEAADRWVIISIVDESTVMLAASKTGDPTGSWARYRLPLGDNGDEIDYTHLALTKTSILVATNLYLYGQTIILSFDKTDFYSTSPKSPAIKYTFNGQVTPVHAPELDVEYLVRGGHSVRRLDDGTWTQIKAPFTWSSGQYSAPQLGSKLELDAGFGDIDHAVYHGGFVYFVQTIMTKGGRTAVLWWIVDPETGDVHDAASIESATEFYSYPSLAVNQRGAMVIGFSVFSKTAYASSAYVYRDATGRISAPASMRTGDSPVSYSERWGDYTTTVVDPLSEDSFWTVQIHAQNATWATAWAKVVTPPSTLRRRSARH